MPSAWRGPASLCAAREGRGGQEGPLPPTVPGTLERQLLGLEGERPCWGLGSLGLDPTPSLSGFIQPKMTSVSSSVEPMVGNWSPAGGE